MESPDPRALIASFGGPAAGVSVAELENLFSRIANHDRDAGPAVVAGKSHARFLAAALGALHLGRTVALASPHWGASERAQAAAQLRPGLWLGDDTRWPDVAPETPFDAAAWEETMLIPTGGTGGRVRWAAHNWQTLSAAARSLDQFLGGGPFTHVSTLPPWHVSGLMPAVRALATGGRLRLEEWETLERGAPPKVGPAGAIISFVPTQLRRLLAQAAVVDWLRGTRAILLGGAPPSSELLDEARALRLPVALAYGMTETAAVVAAQTPEDFLAGEPPSARSLPHARIVIVDDSGNERPAEIAGRIRIGAVSLFKGYYANREDISEFVTEDEGMLDARGRLQVLGRLDRFIITGGEKVDPRLVEQAILTAGLAMDVLVTGAPHPDWGRTVAAFYTGAPVSEADFRSVLAGLLPRIFIPKKWIHVERLPLDVRGKPDRAALETMLNNPEPAA